MSAGPLLFVGQAALDHVFHVERFSAAGGKTVASQQHSRIGGMATRAALAAHSLRRVRDGIEIRLLSAVGDDLAGQQLQQALHLQGIEVACTTGARTPVSAVLVDAQGERQITNFRGDALRLAPLPDLPSLFRGVLADPRWPAAAALALHRARERGVPAVLDADVAEAAVLHRLAPLADWCVFSKGGLGVWAGERELPADTALQRVAAAAPGAELLVTLGADGALWRRPDGQVRALPAHRVAVRDTTGAGDVMHGALLLALGEGMTAEPAVRFAMAAAALACRGSQPTRGELETLLETSA